MKGWTALHLPGNETDARNDRAIDRKEVKPIDRKEGKPMTVASTWCRLKRRYSSTNNNQPTDLKEWRRKEAVSENEKQPKGSCNAQTRYVPFLGQTKQSTNSTDIIGRSHINYWSPMVDCGIGKPPDALEWHEPAMVGMSKRQVRRKWTTGKIRRFFVGLLFAEHTGRPNEEF